MLYDYWLYVGSNPLEIVRVAGDNGLPSPARTNNDVGIDHVGRPGPRQEKADSRGIRSVERNEVRTGLTNEPRELCLPGRVANGLRERPRG
jgi:hypothetical protein